MSSPQVKRDDMKNELIAESPLLTFNEARAYLKVSRSTLYRMMTEGLIEPVRLTPRKPMFLRASLDNFISCVSRKESVNAK